MFFFAKGKVLFCKRKGSFLQKPEKERFFLEKGKVFLEKGKVLLGHKERFFLHIFHTGKVSFGTKKLSLAFLVRRPITEERFLLDTGKVPFGHRESFFGQKSFPVLNLGNIMQRMRHGG